MNTITRVLGPRQVTSLPQTSVQKEQPHPVRRSFETGTSRSAVPKVSQVERGSLSDGIESTQLDESTHIIGPAAAQDAHVLEEYLSPHSAESHKNTYGSYSANPQNPVLYTRISRRRQGLPVTFQPGHNQREILEQIIAPFNLQLVDT